MGMIILAIVELVYALYSVMFHGQIDLLTAVRGVHYLPLNAWGIIVITMKLSAHLFFGAGLVALGFFVGLRSDVMYLPALGGIMFGVIGEVAATVLMTR